MVRTDIDVAYADHVVGVKCPKCKRKDVAYNGNYFCLMCTWIMDEGRGVKNERIIVAYLRQRRARAVDANEHQRMDQHLDDILDRRLGR